MVALLPRPLAIHASDVIALAASILGIFGPTRRFGSTRILGMADGVQCESGLLRGGRENSVWQVRGKRVGFEVPWWNLTFL